MRRRLAVGVLSLTFLSAGAALASHADGIDAWVVVGPGPGQITLQWTGGQPDFTIYRSTNPRLVIAPANQIGISPVRSWADESPPGTLFFYEITSPCVYDPP